MRVKVLACAYACECLSTSCVYNSRFRIVYLGSCGNFETTQPDPCGLGFSLPRRPRLTQPVTSAKIGLLPLLRRATPEPLRS